MSDLNKVFSPKNIAIIGISSSPHKLSTVIYNNLINSEFKGSIYFVNPKYKNLFGKKVYKSILDIPEKIDAVVIAIPTDYVKDVLIEAGEKKVSLAIIITAGFRESGQDGLKRELELKEIAQKYGIRILGPNCLGITSTHNKMNASFSAVNAISGKIAFFSQSGAINTALLDMAQSRNLGFKYFVSLGNKIDINENEILNAWINDPEVSVIGGYLEDFYDGNDFVKIASKANKPIVILNTGKGEASQKAIHSHTGSLATNNVITSTALTQAGVNLVDSIEELFATLLFFERSKIPKGSKTAILTNAGGPAVMLLDLLSNENIVTAKLESEIEKELQKILPSNASVHNPIDILGDADASRYAQALNILEKSKKVDIIFVLISPQYVTQIEETVKIISEISFKSKKCIVPILLGDKYMDDALERLDDRKIAGYKFASLAVKAIKHGINFNFYNKNSYKIPKLNLKIGKYKNILSKIATVQTEPLPEMLSKSIAREFGLTLPQEEIIHTFDEAIDFVNKLGFPVVLKVTTESLPHKTEYKAIYLDINSKEALKHSFNKLMSLCQKYGKSEELLIQEFVNSKIELMSGAIRDGDSNVYTNFGHGFGHLILFGHGGIYAEVFKDTSSFIVPATKEIIEKSIKSTDVYKILNGYRGGIKYDLNLILETLQKLQKIVQTYPEIESIDINPMMLTPDKCYCVDLKIFVKK
ncbi:MAG: acetyl-CoA synthetase [Candidatus Dojkabacteria bacterium]|nr:MAG: acetyl-CoA synthetase [Candidatus Dojkabacteria bacterium]GIW58903.1 MAG: acetyl-CoA synthetase [Candidatus Dojkabacteria bacterium]